MAYETKRGWSRVFVRSTTSEPDHARRVCPAAPAGPTVQEIVDEFLEAVDDGWARDRYGRPFADDDARRLRWYLGGHLGEKLGTMGLSEVRRRVVKSLVHELGSAGMSRRRQRALVTSVRALYDYAIERRLVRGNPGERIAIPDDPDGPQPNVVHHGIELAVRLATLGFALAALIFLTETL